MYVREKELTWKLALEAHQAYLDALHKSMTKVGTYYRVACFGSFSLRKSDPTLKHAFDLGRWCAERSIDIIEGSGPETSVMGQVALGVKQGAQEFKTKARCYGNSIRLPWESKKDSSDDARNLIFEGDTLSARLDLFTGYASSFVAFKGGIGTRYELWHIIQRIQFMIKMGDSIPEGLRLLSRAAELGWIPKVICVGESFNDIKTAMRQMAKNNLLSVKRDENKIVTFVDSQKELKAVLEQDHNEWQIFMRRHGVKIKN